MDREPRNAVDRRTVAVVKGTLVVGQVKLVGRHMYPCPMSVQSFAGVFSGMVAELPAKYLAEGSSLLSKGKDLLLPVFTRSEGMRSS